MGPANFVALTTNNNVTTDGAAVSAQFVFSASAQVISTGAPTGTLKIQASNDPRSSLAVGANGNPIPINWNDLTGVTVSVSTSGALMIPKFDVCYNWLRAVYTDGSGGAGTGTTTVNMQTQSY